MARQKISVVFYSENGNGKTCQRNFNHSTFVLVITHYQHLGGFRRFSYDIKEWTSGKVSAANFDTFNGVYQELYGKESK